MTKVAVLGERQTEYDDLGDPADPALVVVSGIGGHLLGWPTGLCEQLAAAGLRVIRFDQRDTGFATRTAVPAPAPRADGGLDAPAPYGVRELAADVVALMDLLGLERAHVAGISFGGMVAQRVAIDFPERVETLIAIMTSTGSAEVGGSRPEAVEAVMRATDGSEAAVMASALAFQRMTGGPLVDERFVRRFTEESYRRSYDPGAKAYHFAAFVADGDRTAELRQVQAPTLVIHGPGDQLIDVSGGRAIAAAVPRADLLELGDLGHSLLAPSLWPRLTHAIAGKALVG